MSLAKRKIVFAETNASVGNGHHVSNVENIPSAMISADIPFEMVTETNVSGKHLTPFFTPISEIEDTGTNKGVALRKSDYRKFLQKFGKNICFVLSNYAKDIEAWLDVLLDAKYQKLIKKNNTLLVIHAVAFYPLFFTHKKVVRQILKDLKGYVIFSFFTAEIAAVAKKLYGCAGFIGMIHPVYDRVYTQAKRQKVKKKYDFTFWFGGGSNLESHVGGFFKKIKSTKRDFKSAVRISPVRDYNYLLLNYFKSYADIDTYTEGMQNSLCIKLFSQTKIGVLPYDEFEGSVKASAVFENFILCGVPVLVPKKTWMHEVLKSLGSPGLGFTAGDTEDFNNKLKYLHKNYESFELKAKKAADVLNAKINTSAFLKTIFELDDKRSLGAVNFYGNRINESRVAEGYAYFKKLYFSGLTDSKKLNRFKNEIKKDVGRYYKLRFVLIEKNCFEARDLNYFFKNINKYNPSEIAKVLNTFSKAVLTDKKYKPGLKKFIDNSYCYFPISVLNKMAEYGLVSLKVKKDLKQRGFYKDTAVNINLLLADLFDALVDASLAKRFRSKALTTMLKVRRKTVLEKYTIASTFLKIGQLDNAADIYKKILKDKNNIDGLRGSSSFHLGTILLKLKDDLKALSYFRKTLEFIPLHNKAKQYIKTLEEK